MNGAKESTISWINPILSRMTWMVIAYYLIACGNPESKKVFSFPDKNKTHGDFFNAVTKDDSINLLANEYGYRGGGMEIADVCKDAGSAGPVLMQRCASPAAVDLPGIDIVSGIVSPNGKAYHFYFVGLILALFWAKQILNFSLRKLARLNVLIFVSYNVTAVYVHYFNDFFLPKLLVYDGFLIALILFSTISARMIESFILEDRQRKKELMDACQLKSKLLSVISHDVRGPLSSIKGILNSCSLGLITYEELKDSSNKLTDSVDSLLALLDTLMLWSMAQNGNFAMERRTHNLNKVAGEVLLLFTHFADRKQVELKNAVDPEIAVSADIMMLNLIIRNLVSHALKFTSSGSIVINANQSNSLTEIDIQVTGTGINKKIVEKLFGGAASCLSCFELNSESSFGFGLMICEEFIRKHGGSLNCIPHEGRGITLRFTISRSFENRSPAYSSLAVAGSIGKVWRKANSSAEAELKAYSVRGINNPAKNVAADEIAIDKKTTTTLVW